MLFFFAFAFKTKRRILLVVLLHLILQVVFVSKITAAEISVSNIPTAISDQQEVTVMVTVVNAASNTENYLRGAFFHESSQENYFGFTQNHEGSWYNGKPSPIDPHQFLKIHINDEKSWSGEIKIKPDTAHPGFKGGGNYFIKVGRYTANGTSVTDWSSSIPIIIQAPSPTPTPSPTTKPTNTLSPTKSPTATKAPTATKIPTVKPTQTPTEGKTATAEVLSAQNKSSKHFKNYPSIVLGSNDRMTATPTSKQAARLTKNNNTNTMKSTGIDLSYFAIIGGSLFLLGCVIILFLKPDLLKRNR
jgi:hypothetical protein